MVWPSSTLFSVPFPLEVVRAGPYSPPILRRAFLMEPGPPWFLLWLPWCQSLFSLVLLLFLLIAHSLWRFKCWCFLSSVLRPFLCGLIAWDEVIFQKEVGHETSRLLNLPSTDLEESRMWKSETSVSDVCASEIKIETTITSEQKDYVGSSSNYLIITAGIPISLWSWNVL